MQKNLKLLNERLCQKIQEFHDRRQADLSRCVARIHTEIQSIDKFIIDSKHLLLDVNVQVKHFLFDFQRKIHVHFQMSDRSFTSS